MRWQQVYRADFELSIKIVLETICLCHCIISFTKFFPMTNTHLVGTLSSGLLRGLVVIAIAFCSSMAFAQTAIAGMVDAQEATDRLSTHFPAVEAAFNAMSVTDPNYEFEAARVELTLHVYEDVQLGIEPEVTINTRFDEGMGAPAPGGRLSADESVSAGTPPAVAEFDPIVAELVNLLQQQSPNQKL